MTQSFTSSGSDAESRPSGWEQIHSLSERHRANEELTAGELDSAKIFGAFHRRRDRPDAFMLRVRTTASELTAPQARAIAMIAFELGHGIVDITRRGDLQIQGVPLAQVPKSLERIAATGLTCQQTGSHSIRTIFGHPLSGLRSDELHDTRDLCRHITAELLSEPAFADLPFKLNIAVSGGRRHELHFWLQDLAFVATELEPGASPRFQPMVGGRHGEFPTIATPLPVALDPKDVPSFAREIVRLFKEIGPTLTKDVEAAGRRRTRFGDVVEHLGTVKLVALMQERLDLGLAPVAREPEPRTAYEDWIGWIPTNQGNLWSIGVSIPVGRLSWQQLEGLAVAATRWGDGSLRTTTDQGILITGIPAAFKEAVATELGRYGLSHYADSLSRSVVACTGKQFCNLGVVETKGATLRLIERLRSRLLTLHGIRIHMSGCASGCAQHRLADIGLKGVRIKRLLGVRDGFDVYLGGGTAGRVALGEPYKQGVDAEQVPAVIEEVVKEYYLRHQPGYSFSAYWRERLKSTGTSSDASSAAAPITWECEGCQYQHAGDDPPVFCPKCAAVRRHFARLERITSPADAATELKAGEVAIETVPVISIDPPVPTGSERNLDLDAIISMTHSIVDWVKGNRRPPTDTKTSKAKRGRPRDPSVSERDRLIRQRYRELKGLSHQELANQLSDELGKEITPHMIRNAIKRGPRR